MALFGLPLFALLEQVTPEDKHLALIPRAKLGLEEVEEKPAGLLDAKGRPIGGATQNEELPARLPFAPCILEVLENRMGVVFSARDMAEAFLAMSGWQDAETAGAYHVLVIDDAEKLRGLMDYLDKQNAKHFAYNPLPGQRFQVVNVDTLPRTLFTAG